LLDFYFPFPAKQKISSPHNTQPSSLFWLDNSHTG